MNAHQQPRLPDITNNGQDKLKQTLLESKNLLKNIDDSIKQSNNFNLNAWKYLINEAKQLSH